MFSKWSFRGKELGLNAVWFLLLLYSGHIASTFTLKSASLNLSFLPLPHHFPGSYSSVFFHSYTIAIFSVLTLKALHYRNNFLTFEWQLPYKINPRLEPCHLSQQCQMHEKLKMTAS
jgi:hypothetical protein